MTRPFHEHAIYKVSSMGRPIDPRFPSNKAILVVMALALLGGGAAHWLRAPDVLDALLHGLLWAATTFVAWALGRELDPDRPHSAMLGVAGALAVLLAWGDADVWTLGGGLAAARIVNRTIGPRARVTDLTAVAAMVGYATFVEARWPLAVAVAAALAMDAALENGTPDRWVWVAVVLGPAVALIATQGVAVQLPAHGPAMTVGVVIAAAGITTLPPIRSSCDVPGHALARGRVQAGMFVVLLLTVLAQLEVSATPRGLGVAAVLLAAVVGRFVFRAPPEG